ncbi:MAG: hypothetical protein WAO55_14535 [Candidatus Manganitrophaceae bacterium]
MKTGSSMESRTRTSSPSSDESPVVAPGLDQFYEIIFRYGMPMILVGSLFTFLYLLLTVDFSRPKAG